MLSETPSSPRRYYSRHQAITIAVAGGFFLFIFLSGIFASRYAGVKIFVAASVLVLGVIYVRAIRAGIDSTESGIEVRNVFFTFKLPWQVIERFEIGRSGLFPMVCLIHLRDGSSRHAFGIQERGNFPSGSAQSLTQELNVELARQTGIRNPTDEAAA
jgi:hypothetical protein